MASAWTGERTGSTSLKAPQNAKRNRMTPAPTSAITGAVEVIARTHGELFPHSGVREPCARLGKLSFLPHSLEALQREQSSFCGAGESKLGLINRSAETLHRPLKRQWLLFAGCGESLI